MHSGGINDSDYVPMLAYIDLPSCSIPTRIGLPCRLLHPLQSLYLPHSPPSRRHAPSERNFQSYGRNNAMWSNGSDWRCIECSQYMA